MAAEQVRHPAVDRARRLGRELLAHDRAQQRAVGLPGRAPLAARPRRAARARRTSPGHHRVRVASGAAIDLRRRRLARTGVRPRPARVELGLQLAQRRARRVAEQPLARDPVPVGGAASSWPSTPSIERLHPAASIASGGMVSRRISSQWRERGSPKSISTCATSGRSSVTSRSSTYQLDMSRKCSRHGLGRDLGIRGVEEAHVSRAGVQALGVALHPQLNGLDLVLQMLAGQLLVMPKSRKATRPSGISR